MKDDFTICLFTSKVAFLTDCAEGFLLIRDVTGRKYIYNQRLGFPILLDDFYSSELSDPIIMDNHFCFQLLMLVSLQDIGDGTIKETWVFKLDNEKIVKETCSKGHNTGFLNSMEI